VLLKFLFGPESLKLVLWGLGTLNAEKTHPEACGDDESSSDGCLGSMKRCLGMNRPAVARAPSLGVHVLVMSSADLLSGVAVGGRERRDLR